MKDKILSKNLLLFFKLFILPIMILAGFFIIQGNAMAAEPVEPTDFAILHFDENTGRTAYDSTDNHNDFSWGHNFWAGGRYFPERVEGRWDVGIYFNQHEEGFTLLTSTPIEFLNGLTVGAWIKTDLDSPHCARFFWIGNTLSNKVPINHFMLSVKDGRAYLHLKQNKAWQPQPSSTAIVNDNQWHFINARFNTNDKTMSLFVDGQKQDQVNFELPVPLFEYAVIGKREDYWAKHYNTNFKGAIDDVWIKAESLSDAQIERIYQSNSPYKADVILPPLIQAETQVYYNFDENSGNVAHDLSGNNYNLNWSHNHWVGGEPTPRWLIGKYGNAVNFKKVEDSFSRNFSPSLNFLDGMVVGTWVKTAASSSLRARIVWFGNALSKKGDPENNFIMSEYQGKARIDLRYKDGCDTSVYGPRCQYRTHSITSAKLINDNNWHFLTTVLDPRPYHHSMKLYIDGELEAEGFFPSPVPFAERIKVGYRENYYCYEKCNFDGDIDDLFILSSVISDDEVKQIYQSNQAFVWPIEIKIDPLILRYEPILYLHPDETYQPMNVEAYVNHCSLWDSRGAAPDVLLETENSSNPVTLDNLNFTGIDSSKYYLQFSQNLVDKMPDADKAKVEYQQMVDNGEVKYTYYARKMIDTIDTVDGTGEEYIVLQYWFFYAMSDFGAHVEKGNIHEGDWEVVMVFLNKETEEPKYVAHSIHYNRGEKGFPGFQYTSVRNKWDSAELNKEETHVFSLIGLGSHANYPNNGDNGIHYINFYPDDITSLNGLRIDQGNWQKRFVFEENNFPGWLVDYKGWWGAYNGKPGYTGTNPPYYTLYNKFNEPIKWAGIDKIGKLEVLTESQYAFHFAKQVAKIIFDRTVDKGTVFLVDLHDEIIQFGQNLKEIVFLPHFWDIESNLKNNKFKAEVSFEYDADEVAALNIDENNLIVFNYNETNNFWEKIPSVVDVSNKVIKFFTSHFSQYAIGVEKWQDITKDVKAIKRLKHYNYKTNIKQVKVRIKNKTKQNITGDLRLIVKNIDKSGVEFINTTGATMDGYPYIEIDQPYNHCVFTGNEQDIPEPMAKRKLLSRFIKRKIKQKKPLPKKLCEKIISQYPELEDKFQYILPPNRFTQPMTLEFSLPVKQTKIIKMRGKKITIYIPEFSRFGFEVEVKNKVVEWEWRR